MRFQWRKPTVFKRPRKRRRSGVGVFALVVFVLGAVGWKAALWSSGGRGGLEVLGAQIIQVLDLAPRPTEVVTFEQTPHPVEFQMYFSS